MPRLKQVSREKAPANVLKFYDALFGSRDPVTEPGTATGTPGNWWTVFALVPYVFQHATDHFGMFGMFAEKSVQKVIIYYLGKSITIFILLQESILFINFCQG